MGADAVEFCGDGWSGNRNGGGGWKIKSAGMMGGMDLIFVPV